MAPRQGRHITETIEKKPGRKGNARTATAVALRFFAVTYAVTWMLWIIASALAGAVGAGEWSSPALRELLYLPGTVAPGVVALVFVLRVDGPAAVRRIISRIGAWRLPARWYFFAALYLVSMELIAAAGYRVIRGDWPAIDLGLWYAIVPAIGVSMWVQAGEEIGWRGFALPTLARDWGIGPASVVVGLVWASWHLPLFFIPGAAPSGQSFVLYLLQVVALSVAMAYLYWRTHASLLLVMLMHASVNNTTGIVQSTAPDATPMIGLSSSLLGWLTTAVMWAFALYFIVRLHGERELRST